MKMNTMPNESSSEKMKNKNKIAFKSNVQTGWPRQEKSIPPIAADTMTTTKSEISLHASNMVKIISWNLSYTEQTWKERTLNQLEGQDMAIFYLTSQTYYPANTQTNQVRRCGNEKGWQFLLA